MGASAWFYLVDHEDDPRAALRALRDRVFESGDYYLAGRGGAAPPAFEDYLAQMPPDLVADVGEDEVRRWHAQQAARVNAEPTSIDQLLALAAEDGTHSVLDVGEIADAPRMGALSPMPESEREKLFGSARPSRDVVEAAQHAIHSPAGRWSGYYFTVYDDDANARWLCFAGVSGD